MLGNLFYVRTREKKSQKVSIRVFGWICPELLRCATQPYGSRCARFLTHPTRKAIEISCQYFLQLLYSNAAPTQKGSPSAIPSLSGFSQSIAFSAVLSEESESHLSYLQKTRTYAAIHLKSLTGDTEMFEPTFSQRKRKGLLTARRLSRPAAHIRRHV